MSLTEDDLINWYESSELQEPEKLLLFLLKADKLEHGFLSELGGFYFSYLRGKILKDKSKAYDDWLNGKEKAINELVGYGLKLTGKRIEPDIIKLLIKQKRA